MSYSRSSRHNSSSNQSVTSITSKKSTTKFPLPNATRPRYIVSKKLEISELPDDILLYVFRFLSPIDLFSISSVCRRWYNVSQDESLWRSLAIAYNLHQLSSNLTNKQRIQEYLNNQIKTQLKTLFPTKFDPLKSYTGIADYKKIFDKYSEQFHFHLAFCDDKHRIIESQKSDTIKYFETSLSIRWLGLTNPEILSRVHYIRLFSTVSIDLNTRPNRIRLPKSNEQLRDITEKPIRYIQKIQSLLHEYEFKWNLIKTKSISLTNDVKSPILISKFSDEDDCLLALYQQDKSFAFLLININYLAFHEQFFTGLRSTNLIHNKPLSQIMMTNQFPKTKDLEVSVFICFRNMTTIFLRHRFLNCRLKYSNTPIIELIRTTDMMHELGPELEQLPKFNWKTEIFKGTLDDLFIIDMVVLNERKNVIFTLTIPVTFLPGMDNEQMNQQGKDYIVSSNVWNFKGLSQCNNRIHIDGTIMKLDSEYCALGKDSQSWHLQNMTCSF